MKKKIALMLSLLVVALLSLVACIKEDPVDPHVYVEHTAVAPTCTDTGSEFYYSCSHCEKIFDANKNEISAIPTVEANGHDFVLHEEVSSTCSTKGTLSHYTCNDCSLIFDLNKEVIDSVEVDFDSTNHSSDPTLIIAVAPAKTAYVVGETFDTSGMQIVYGCKDCEGEILDTQFLTVTYQTEGATAFAMGDTKVTLTYGELSIDVEITVGKKQAVISGVEESYQTVCKTAPSIEASVNYTELNIAIEYFDAEDNLIEVADLLAGGEYYVKVWVEETADVSGAEVVASVIVLHEHDWRNNSENWDKIEYACTCGDSNGVYVLNNAISWVDERDISFDFSNLVVGATSVAVDSVKKVDGETLVDLEPTLVEGFKYTYKVEDFNVTEYTPYELHLKVALTVDGNQIELDFFGKYADGVIKTAEDLSMLVYTGTTITGYYVIANDIDASAFLVNSATPCWVDEGGFQGVLDGQGHTVSNIHVVGGIGLFGAIGARAKVVDVNFTNVKVDVEYALAFAVRNATFKNVSIEFAKDSKILKVAYTFNATTFDNFTVKTGVECGVPFLIDENVENAIPSGVTVTYYPTHNVLFNSNGGTSVEAIVVTDGRAFDAPVAPVKASDDNYDYDFAGWYVGEDLYDFSAPVTEDLVLDAKWDAVEKSPYGKVILNAKSQNLTKWDYGNAIAVTASTDDTYGAIWSVVIDNIAEQSLQHDPVDVEGFERVCFYVYNPCAGTMRLTIHGGYDDGWALKTMELVGQSWTKVEVSVSAFEVATPGQIFLMIQDPSAVSVGGEWKITSFYGLKTGETAPDVEKPEEPEIPEVDSNVLVDAKTQTLTKWDIGGDLTVTNSTDLAYGDVWNVTIGAMVEQSITHGAIVTDGFERVYFYVYNPCDYAVRLVIHGGWTAWNVQQIMLGSKTWAKVEVDVSTFTTDVAGQIFIVLQDPDAVSVAGEWKITSFVGLKEGEEAPAIVNPVLVDAKTQTLTRWDYGNEITVVNSTDDTYGDVMVMTVSDCGEQGFTHPVINTYDFDTVYFFVFNPCAYDVRFNVHGATTWGAQTLLIPANSWTRIELKASLINENGAGKVGFVIQDPNAVSVAGEWKITSFIGE